MKKLLLALLLIVTPVQAEEYWVLGNMAQPDITKRNTWQGFEYNIGNWEYTMTSNNLMETLTFWARAWFPDKREFSYVEIRFHCFNKTRDFLYRDTRRPILDSREYINPGHTDWKLFNRLCSLTYQK